MHNNHGKVVNVRSLPQPIPRGGLLVLPTTKSTTLGSWPSLEN